MNQANNPDYECDLIIHVIKYLELFKNAWFTQYILVYFFSTLSAKC